MLRESDGIVFDRSRSANQELTFLYAENYFVVTRKDVELLLGKSKFTAIQALNKLLAEGKIIKMGAAKAVQYRLKA